jgi:replication-associated recombination protein RarA
MKAMSEFAQPLAIKYQPKRIADFIGIKDAKAAVAGFARRPRTVPLLFKGPSGTGKTTMAQALAEEIGAELIHIPSQHCTVAELEQSINMTMYFPMSGKKCWMVLVDEADQMTDKAQLALLSKLDSTGMREGVIFVFTCNDIDRFEPRFLSRCMQIDFSSYGMAAEITAYLEKVWHAEGGNGNGPDFTRLAKDTRNNVRDCLMRLEVSLLELS